MTSGDVKKDIAKYKKDSSVFVFTRSVMCFVYVRKLRIICVFWGNLSMVSSFKFWRVAEISQVSITFACDELASSSTGTYFIWQRFHGMGILLPSVCQLDSRSSRLKVCPELRACWWGNHVLGPGQWGSEGTCMSAVWEAVFNTASVIVMETEGARPVGLQCMWSLLITQKQVLYAGPPQQFLPASCGIP